MQVYHVGLLGCYCRRHINHQFQEIYGWNQIGILVSSNFLINGKPKLVQLNSNQVSVVEAADYDTKKQFSFKLEDGRTGYKVLISALNREGTSFQRCIISIERLRKVDKCHSGNFIYFL